MVRSHSLSVETNKIDYSGSPSTGVLGAEPKLAPGKALIFIQIRTATA